MESGGVHAQKLAQRIDERAARKSGVQMEIGAYVLLDLTAAPRAPRPHDSREDAGAGHQISTPGAGGGDHELAYAQSGGLTPTRRGRFHRLRKAQHRQVRIGVAAHEARGLGFAGTENQRDVFFTPQSVARGYHRIGSDDDAAGRMTTPMHRHYILASPRRGFSNLVR